MSIPKPGSLKARPALIRLHMLHEAMTETHATIQSFQDFKVACFVGSVHIDAEKRKAQYSVEAWAKFLDKVSLLRCYYEMVSFKLTHSQILSVQPELTFYEDYWPIEVYFDIYMGNRRGHWRRKNYNRGSQNSTMASEVSYDDNVENAGASSSKPSLNIRDTQQPVSRGPFPPGKSSNKYSADPFSNKVGTQSGRSTMTLSARSQSPGWRSINATASTSTTVHGRPTSGNSRVPVNLDASPRMSIRDHSKMEEKLIVACLACGITATVKSVFKKRLVNLVGNVDLLPILAKLGIFLDQHLDDLHRLKHDDLMRFLSDVASNQITPLAKLQFIKSLQSESFNGRKQRTLHSAFISCPPLHIERHLSDPQAYHLYKGLFQKTLKLEDDDFQELMDTMETMSRDYFSIYHPNTDQLCEVITAICGESRVLNRYDNLWPLKIYLKRRSTSIGTRPLYNETEAEAVFSKVFKNQCHFDLPTLIQLPCELHPIIDISKVPHTLKARLHTLGIAGLIPALAYVGVHSDAHFADFCNLNDQERDDLFILGKVKLSQLQRFTLSLAVSRF